MEIGDVLGSSTAPLTWHDFLERMRHPAAADCVKSIKSFIVSFLNNAPEPQRDSAAVQEFLSNMEVAFRAHSLWAGCSEEELESAGEGLEKYVMTKLFSRVFASTSDDVKVDDQLHKKMALLQQFIRPENLDIKPTFQNETSWLLAQKELQKINMYKAPRDKLVCILNCCKVINNLLLNASIASNENPPGADEFLPVLIYVTIKANPPQLHSNLLYIQRYRRQSRLIAEAAYYFTNMLSVESFILNIDANALSMDETEFERNMKSAQSLLSSLGDNSDDLSSTTAEAKETKQEASNFKRHQVHTMQPYFSSELSDTKSGSKQEPYTKDQSSLTKVPSISDLENKGASMLLKEDQISIVLRDFPYLFSRAGDLTLGDVEELLNNYKHIVFKYVCLSKGLGIASPSLPLSTSQSQSQRQSEIVKEEDGDTDTDQVGKNNEVHVDAGRAYDDSNESLLFGIENSESKSLGSETVASQGEGNDEVSQR